MRIAIVQPRISYYNGGGERYPMDAITRIASLFKDIKFDVYTTKTDFPETHRYSIFKNEANQKKIRIIEKEIPKKFTYLYDIQAGEDRFRWDAESLYFSNIIRDDIAKNKPDIIWSYYLLDGLEKPEGTRSILHLLGYPRTASEYRDAFIAQYDRIVPISRNVGYQWNRLLQYPFIAKHVLPQGIDLNVSVKKLVHMDRGSFNIVFAGRLIERKGVLTLLESLSKVITTYKKVSLYILGDGPQMGQVSSFVSDNHLKDYVHLEGHVDNPLDYFHSADLCVFPSYAGEGLMSSVLEAMYYNGLVITTKYNGNEEAITDGSNGFLLEPGDVDSLEDRILYIINHRDEFNMIKNRAKSTISDNFSWERYAAKFNDICLEALSNL